MDPESQSQPAPRPRAVTAPARRDTDPRPHPGADLLSQEMNAPRGMEAHSGDTVGCSPWGRKAPGHLRAQRSLGPPGAASGWSPHPGWLSRCGTAHQGRWRTAAGCPRGWSHCSEGARSLPRGSPSRTGSRTAPPPWQRDGR